MKNLSKTAFFVATQVKQITHSVGLAFFIDVRTGVIMNVIKTNVHIWKIPGYLTQPKFYSLINHLK